MHTPFPREIQITNCSSNNININNSSKNNTHDISKIFRFASLLLLSLVKQIQFEFGLTSLFPYISASLQEQEKVKNMDSVQFPRKILQKAILLTHTVLKKYLLHCALL